MTFRDVEPLIKKSSAWQRALKRSGIRPVESSVPVACTHCGRHDTHRYAVRNEGVEEVVCRACLGGFYPALA